MGRVDNTPILLRFGSDFLYPKNPEAKHDYIKEGAQDVIVGKIPVLGVIVEDDNK